MSMQPLVPQQGGGQPTTCRCGGCVKCYDLRGDCQRVVTEDVDWCEPCADEYEHTLRAVMFEAFERPDAPNQQVSCAACGSRGCAAEPCPRCGDERPELNQQVCGAERGYCECALATGHDGRHRCRDCGDLYDGNQQVTGEDGQNDDA